MNARDFTNKQLDAAIRASKIAEQRSRDAVKMNEHVKEFLRAPVSRAYRVRKAVARARANRRAEDDAMRSLGLVKVRGARGGTYWE